MKFELWQLLLNVTSVVVIIGVLCTNLLPLDVRWGIALVFVGVLLTFGRSTLPRPALREHVPNDRQLQRWSDVLVFGLPGSVLVCIGSIVLLSSGVFGFVLGVVYFAAYCTRVFTRD